MEIIGDSYSRRRVMVLEDGEVIGPEEGMSAYEKR